MSFSHKKVLYPILERITVKVVLHLLKVSGSFSTYLVTQLTEYGFEKLIIPLINTLVRKGHLYYDTNQGKIIARRLQDAQDNSDQDAYDDAWDDMLH